MTGFFRKLAPAFLIALCVGTPLAAQSERAPAPRYGFVQDYEPRPAIWLLSDDDTQIYLFGTIHELPRGFAWRNPQLDRILGEVDALVVESSDADLEAGLQSLAPKMERMVAQREPTSQQLSPTARAQWMRLIQRWGLPFDAIDNMPLLLAMLTFGELSYGGVPSAEAYGVETVLEAEFLASERPVLSIEDAEEVTFEMLRANDRVAVAGLEQDLLSWGNKDGDPYFAPREVAGNDDGLLVEHAWARGETGDVMAINFGESQLGDLFERVMLAERNSSWTNWLINRLDEPGDIFVAVGAAHFAGESSVIDMLARRGYTVRRVSPEPAAND